MTIDKVIEEATQFLMESHVRAVSRVEALRNIRNILAAVKQLRDENADLTNRLTDAQDFINDRIEKGRR